MKRAGTAIKSTTKEKAYGYLKASSLSFFPSDGPITKKLTAHPPPDMKNNAGAAGGGGAAAGGGGAAAGGSPNKPGWTKVPYTFDLFGTYRQVYRKNDTGRYWIFVQGKPDRAITLDSTVKNSNGNIVKLGESLKKKGLAAPKPKAKKTPAAAPAPAPAPVAPVVPVQVVTVSLVPVVKPTEDHLRAKASYFTARVAKAAEQMKKIREDLEESNTKTNKNNFCKAGQNMGFVHGGRVNRLYYKYSVVPGFSAGGSWSTSLEVPKFQYKTHTFELAYSEYHFAQELIGKYGRNINSYGNVNPRMMMDPKWFAAQDKYIRSLTPYKLFTLYGYTHNGDKWAHAYLSKTFNLSLFHSAIQHKSISSEYFAFFFQARDFYKINTGNIKKDYQEVINRMNDEKKKDMTEYGKHVDSIICMFINDLNQIIADAPATTHSFVLFRGQTNDAYKTGAATLSGTTTEVYTSERFCSASISGSVALTRFAGDPKHTLQRITVLKGSKCVLLFGITKYHDEYEILLPRGATYQIHTKRQNVQIGMSGMSEVCYGPSIAHVKHLVDMVLLGTNEPPASTKAVPVVVDPGTNSHVMQKYLINKNTKITGLLGKGGYGVVFQGTKKNVGNVAIKFQKRTANSNAEAKALIKLRGSAAPKFYGNSTIKANSNILSVIPGRPHDPNRLKLGNNVHVMVSNYIRGNPLKAWYKKPPVPLPDDIKTKIRNAVANMHKKGVIHGNLHRDNIIVANDGRVFLIDFGKSLVTNKSFNSLNNANNYLKGLRKNKPAKASSHNPNKLSYYSNNKRTHFLNGYFVKGLK
jgi:predicted Ser/Thr protein kinase